MQDTAWLTGANTVIACIQLGQGVIVARLLGPTQYGVAALVFSYVGLIYSLLDPRTSEGSTKYLAEFDTKGEPKRALAVCKVGYAVDAAVSAFVCAFVIVTGTWAETHIVRIEGTLPLLTLCGVALIPRSVTGTSYATLATLGRFSLMARLQVLSTAVQAVVIVGLLAAGLGVAGVVYGSFVEAVFSGLVWGAAAHRTAQRRWGGTWLTASWRELTGRYTEILRFYGLSDLNVMMQTVLARADVTIIGFFRTPIEAGYYKLAKTLAESAVSLVTNPLRAVVYPDMSRSVHLPEERQHRSLGFELSTRIGVPVGLAMATAAASAAVWLPWVFGREYTSSVLAFQGIAVASAINGVFWWVRSWYYSRGLVGTWSLVVLAPNALALAMWLTLTPRFGYLAVAWTLPVANMILYGIALPGYMLLQSANRG